MAKDAMFLKEVESAFAASWGDEFDADWLDGSDLQQSVDLVTRTSINGEQRKALLPDSRVFGGVHYFVYIERRTKVYKAEKSKRRMSYRDAYGC